MVTIKCDRCGREDEDVLKMHAVQITELFHIARYDLCDRCYGEFNEWLRELKMQGENKDER